VEACVVDVDCETGADGGALFTETVEAVEIGAGVDPVPADHLPTSRPATTAARAKPARMSPTCGPAERSFMP